MKPDRLNRIRHLANVAETAFEARLGAEKAAYEQLLGRARSLESNLAKAMSAPADAPGEFALRALIEATAARGARSLSPEQARRRSRLLAAQKDLARARARSRIVDILNSKHRR